MNATVSSRRQELEDAFLAFNHMSEQLETSYRELELRVAQLNEELSAARSERLRQLAEKERLANRLESLLDALPAGVVVLDGDGVIQEANPAAKDLLGEPLIGLAWLDVLQRAFTPTQEKAHEFTLYNGRLVSLSVRSLGSEPGKIILLQDVTETRGLEEMLQRQKRLSELGEMAAGMAHQIRTPLAAALLYVSHLGRSDLKPAARQKFSEKVASRLRHMESQVNDMLLFARGGHSHQESLTLGELADALQQALEPQLVVGDIALQLGGNGFSHRFRGNREALLGALTNLANNAIQACPNNLRLQVDFDADASGVCITVCDNGPGMDEATRAKVFDPFFTTRTEGTGLGLPVVQSVVSAHHGRIELQTSPGEGTCFHLYLPVTGQVEALASGQNGNDDVMAEAMSA